MIYKDVADEAQGDYPRNIKAQAHPETQNKQSSEHDVEWSAVIHDPPEEILSCRLK